MSDMSWSKAEIGRAALAEIERPQLAITKQFFSVNSLAEKDQIAAILENKGGWSVYLRIKDEPYFWVSEIELSANDLEAVWGYCVPYSQRLPSHI